MNIMKKSKYNIKTIMAVAIILLFSVHFGYKTIRDIKEEIEKEDEKIETIIVEPLTIRDKLEKIHKDSMGSKNTEVRFTEETGYVEIVKNLYWHGTNVKMFTDGLNEYIEFSEKAYKIDGVNSIFYFVMIEFPTDSDVEGIYDSVLAGAVAFQTTEDEFSRHNWDEIVLIRYAELRDSWTDAYINPNIIYYIDLDKLIIDRDS